MGSRERKGSTLTRGQVGSAEHILHETHADRQDALHAEELVYGCGIFCASQQSTVATITTIIGTIVL